MNYQRMKKLITLIVSHIILFFVCSQTSNITILTWLSIFQLVVLLYVIGINEGRIALIPIAFLVISYVFNFSGLILGEIIGYRSGYLFYLKFENDVMKQAVIYYFVITACIALGAIFSRRLIIFKHKYRFYSEYKLKIVAIFFLVIGIIPHLIIITRMLIARFMGGYIATYEINRQGLGFLSMFFYYGALFLMFVLKNKKDILKLVLLIIPIEILSMFSGRRYEAVSFLVSLFIIYLYKHEKIEKKTIVFSVLVVLMGIVVINIFGAIREGDIDSASVSNRFGTTNALYSFFIEMGNTIRTLLLTIKYVPATVPFGNGKSFYEFLPRIIPGIRRLFLEDYNFTTLLPENYNIGGSYVAELYYNFKWFGVIIAFIIGRLLNILDISIKTRNSFNAVIGVCLLLPTIEYLRDVFYTYRYGVYFIIITYVFIAFSFSRINACGRNAIDAD